eukprot:CAMPEP_0119546558 /NCGR_PEP_ID=MMETSP1352-20130426/927_1 /TAXON_ID=265584 /ORGANISM="Stauroneis constricta, Strain CCMP1120" /LENGTH=571 /DNA_ID=CAMNT_0007591277 /DNA_START=303 /DNA_END=2018 /DNA_ORIENTATION=-
MGTFVRNRLSPDYYPGVANHTNSNTNGRHNSGASLSGGSSSDAYQNHEQQQLQQDDYSCSFLGGGRHKIRKTSLSVSVSSSSAASSSVRQQYYQHQQPQSQSQPDSLIQPDKQYSLDTITDGERLLANELQSLTIQDRELVYDEIHGIIHNTPSSDSQTENGHSNGKGNNDDGKNAGASDAAEALNQQLEQLQVEIDVIRKKDAYNRAAFLSPFAVENVTLRKRILQSAQGNPKVAAKRMDKYFQVKLQLFGEYAFVRPIRWTDLCGLAQWILENDALVRHESITTNERSVLIFNFARFPCTNNGNEVHAILQALWYINATIPPKSMSSQKNGMITITNTIDAKSQQMFNFLKALQDLSRWGFTNTMPLRMTSNHICFGDSQMKPYISLLLLAVSQDMRLRTKFHFGSPLECMYELGAYGVPGFLLNSLDRDYDTTSSSRPSSPHGSQLMPRQLHLQKMFEYEQQLWDEYINSKPPHLHFRPSSTCVLLGRGYPFQSYEGNQNLMKYLETQKHLYEEADGKTEKTAATSAIAQSIIGRTKFLRRSGLFWEEVPSTVARQKISMSVRNLSRR